MPQTILFISLIILVIVVILLSNSCKKCNKLFSKRLVKKKMIDRYDVYTPYTKTKTIKDAMGNILGYEEEEAEKPEKRQKIRYFYRCKNCGYKSYKDKVKVIN